MKLRSALIDIALISLVVVGLVYAQDINTIPYSQDTTISPGTAATPVQAVKPVSDEPKTPDRLLDGTVITVDTAKNTFTVQRTRTFEPKENVKLENIKKGDEVSVLYYGEYGKLYAKEVKIMEEQKPELINERGKERSTENGDEKG